MAGLIRFCFCCLLSLKRNCRCCRIVASQEEEETFSLVERENGGDTWKSDGVETSQKGTNKTIKIGDGRGEMCLCVYTTAATTTTTMVGGPGFRLFLTSLFTDLQWIGVCVWQFGSWRAI